MTPKRHQNDNELLATF